MNRWACVIIGSLLLALVACKPRTPRQYIQPGKMEDILVDYHIAKALAQRPTDDPMDRNYQLSLYIEAALAKHGVTKAQFDSSLVYYYTRADRFEPIYKRVSERLEEQALTYGASDNEIGKYANASGDTANVWTGKSSMLMLPKAPYNRWDFELEGDSVFKRGDSFMMQFMSDFMYQSGGHNAMLYVAITYNDTTIGRQLRFSTSGINELNVLPKDQSIKYIKGFFYLPDEEPKMTNTRLLFLNNVQLIRFHKKEDENKEDSLSQVDTGGQLAVDTVSVGDSVGGSQTLVPPQRRTGPHGVARRLRQLDARPRE